MAGGVHGRGRGMCSGNVCVAEGHVWQGACVAKGEGGWRGLCMHGRRDGHCSGWYASYWNAFLFFQDIRAFGVPAFVLQVTSAMGFKARIGTVCLGALLPVCNGFLRFTSGAQPADNLATSMAANPLLTDFSE